MHRPLRRGRRWPTQVAGVPADGILKVLSTSQCWYLQALLHRYLKSPVLLLVHGRRRSAPYRAHAKRLECRPCGISVAWFVCHESYQRPRPLSTPAHALGMAQSDADRGQEAGLDSQGIDVMPINSSTGTSRVLSYAVRRHAGDLRWPALPATQGPVHACRADRLPRVLLCLA